MDMGHNYSNSLLLLLQLLQSPHAIKLKGECPNHNSGYN
jgi:hypothetical protein